MRQKARLAVTGLDAAVLTLGSAALVLALGAHARLHVAGSAVHLGDPWRPAVLAAVCLLGRFVVDRHAPPLPGLPRPQGRFGEERARLEQPEPWTRRTMLYGGAAVLGSLVWVLPQALHLHSLPDPGDPLFSAWRVAALAHQLVTDPRHLWNGNILYPLPLTIAYSDSLFLQSLLGAPLLVAHVDPILVANALMVISFPARGLAFFILTWRLTGDAEAAVIAALVAAWSPFYPDHYSQLELNWTMFVPLAILALLQVLARPRWRTGALFGVAFGLQCLSCMYVSVMFATMLAPFTVMMLAAWRPPLAGLVRAAAGTLVVLLPVVVLLGVPYLGAREAHGERGLDEITAGSADPADYGDAHIRLVAYRWQDGRRHHVERELFPGVSGPALALVAAVPPLTPVATATLVAGALAFDWSLGVKGLTYAPLYRASPVYRGMRVPARFSAIVDAALALLAGYGARRVLKLGTRPLARAAVCAILAAIVLCDLRMDPGLHPYTHRVPALYAQVTPDMVLAEFPRTLHEIDYMYFSTSHWAHLIGGYSGFIPLSEAVIDGFMNFPAPAALARLHAYGATHVTYNCAFEPDRGRCEEVLAALADNPALMLVGSQRWEGAPLVLYRFR